MLFSDPTQSYYLKTILDPGRGGLQRVDSQSYLEIRAHILNRSPEVLYYTKFQIKNEVKNNALIEFV